MTAPRADEILSDERLAEVVAEKIIGKTGQQVIHIRPVLLHWIITDLQRHRAAAKAVEALFAGGPDTSCRTVWDGDIECVSVPVEDLRAALRGES